MSANTHPVPIFVEVLKKRKVNATAKVWAKCPTVPERKGV
jgi:hypothetical protein